MPAFAVVAPCPIPTANPMSAPTVQPAETLYPFECPPWNSLWLWWLLTVAVLVAVYYAAAVILFPVFFVLPVLLIAWNGRLARALLAVAALCAIRIVFQFHWGLPWGLAAALVNAAVRYAVLSLLAVLTARVATHTRVMRRRVRMLEGMLPICGFCKDIRDDAGGWVKLENYISRHSAAQFTTGICPDCARQHYGAYLEKHGARHA